jgi:hypothetical protein
MLEGSNTDIREGNLMEANKIYELFNNSGIYVSKVFNDVKHCFFRCSNVTKRGAYADVLHYSVDVTSWLNKKLIAILFEILS